MGSQLPFLTEKQFRQRLVRVVPNCPADTPSILYTHYLELRRWNGHLSLVGPGTADEVVERHYCESLEALSLFKSSDESVLDLGTGAGFPGFILAAALPSVHVTLVEPRERKWAFLQAALRRCGLSSQCLNVRVERPLSKEFPRAIDVITCRAVSLTTRLIETLYEGFPGVRLLLWCGARTPDLPNPFRLEREIVLAGSRSRRILEIQVSTT